MSLGLKELNIVLFSFTALSRIENISGKKPESNVKSVSLSKFGVSAFRVVQKTRSKHLLHLLGLKIISIHATLPYLSGMNHQCHVNVLGAGEVPQGRDGLVLDRELVVSPTTTTKRVISTGTIRPLP